MANDQNIRGQNVHWDGKMMEDLTSLENVDRLHIIVSSAEEEQLLGVPKLLKQRLSWTVW